MKDYFSFINQFCLSKIENGEYLSGYFSSEEMDFLRFNQNKIRQAGSVSQRYLNLNLSKDEKQTNITLSLSGQKKIDEEAIAKAYKKLRNTLDKSAKDPYLFLNTNNQSSLNEGLMTSPPKEAIIETLLNEAKGLDLVGLYVGGPIYRGFFNSVGQTNWFCKSSFIIDSSIYFKEDQAVKISYTDTNFNPEIIKHKIDEAKLGLELFKQGKNYIEPKSYRVYFSPEAVYEILSLLNFGGFSKKSLLTKSSPLLSIFDGKKNFHKDFSLYENSLIALGANFQSQGFLKPKTLPIIENGLLKNTLISPKTAKEYKLDHNGADNDESMSAMDMSSGNLLKEDILTCLDDGLFINNLWYLNYSDKLNGRITGMTRFLCYTVKNGHPQKAFGVMRFDESIYKIFGDNLEHITKDRELIVDSSTYDERATSCALLPGIIVKDVRFTL